MSALLHLPRGHAVNARERFQRDRAGSNGVSDAPRDRLTTAAPPNWQGVRQQLAVLGGLAPQGENCICKIVSQPVQLGRPRRSNHASSNTPDRRDQQTKQSQRERAISAGVIPCNLALHRNIDDKPSRACDEESTSE
jgi:hypothetical protein